MDFILLIPSHNSLVGVFRFKFDGKIFQDIVLALLIILLERALCFLKFMKLHSDGCLLNSWRAFLRRFIAVEHYTFHHGTGAAVGST